MQRRLNRHQADHRRQPDQLPVRPLPHDSTSIFNAKGCWSGKDRILRSVLG